MPKFVIVGSCRFEPYIVVAMPRKLTNTEHTTEKGYTEACKIFYPAIDSLGETDGVIVWAPDGIGEHTKRDIRYAQNKGKKVYLLKEMPFQGDVIGEESAWYL